MTVLLSKTIFIIYTYARCLLHNGLKLNTSKYLNMSYFSLLTKINHGYYILDEKLILIRWTIQKSYIMLNLKFQHYLKMYIFHWKIEKLDFEQLHYQIRNVIKKQGYLCRLFSWQIFKIIDYTDSQNYNITHPL